MEMDVRVDHHQHEVVDLLGGHEAFERVLNVAGDRLKFSKGCCGQVRKVFVVAIGDKNHSAERDLFGARENAPVLIVSDERIWPTKL
nr:hypothetical protein [Henriciella marina]